MTEPDEDLEPADGTRPEFFHLWWLARTHVGKFPDATPTWAVPTDAGYRYAQALIEMAIAAARREDRQDGDHDHDRYPMSLCEMAVGYGRSMLPFPDSSVWDTTAVRLGTLQLAGRLAARVISEALADREDAYTMTDIRRAVGQVVGRLWPGRRAAGPSPEAFRAGRHLYRMIKESDLSSTQLPAGLDDLHRAATANGSMHPVALHHLVRSVISEYRAHPYLPYLPAAVRYVVQGIEEPISS